MRYLISGVTSCQSRGVEALVTSILQALPENSTATVMTQTPVYDGSLVREPGANFVLDPFVVSKSLREAGDAPGVEAVLADHDLVIATGGDLHTPDYGVSTRYLRAVRAAKDRGLPVAMIGQSMGRFSPGPDRDALASILSEVDHLSVREATTHAYLIDDLGLPPQDVRLTADPAFLLPPAPTAKVEELLTTAGADGQPYVVVAPSAGIATFGGVDAERHAKVLASLVDRLSRDRQVVLIPHAHDSRAFNDDRILARDVAAKARTTQAVVLDAELTASQYKGVLRGAEFVLAERLHVAIGAISSLTPTYLVGHAHKFDGVLAHTYGSMTTPVPHAHVQGLVANPAASDEITAIATDGQRLARMRDALAARVPDLIALARADIHAALDLAAPSMTTVG